MRTLLALLAAAAPAWCALDYARFAPPAGGFTLEYPANWKRYIAMEAVNLQPPGKDGETVRVSFERYPLGKDSPRKPQDFIKELLEPVGKTKKLDSREPATVAGVKSERLSLTETADLTGPYGQKLPGPMREIYLVVPQKGFYYVLSLKGLGKPFQKALPEFERMARKLTLGPAKKEKS